MKANIRFASVMLTVCLFLLAGFSQVVLAQSDYDGVFIFGDSLSDAGNIYALTGETAKAPYALIPSTPYAIGGHHFSNGKTWAERFAQALKDNNGGKASWDRPGENGNYAHGGARARSSSTSAAPSSTQQASLFIGDYGVAPANALYVVQFGGNDIRDALTGNPADAATVLQGAIGDIAATIQMLYGAGARHFLVANAPNIQHAPAVQLGGPIAVAGAGQLVTLYNLGLEGTLSFFDALPGISIRRLDMGGFIDEVVTDPERFGLTNVTAPCLVFFAESDAKCDAPENYLFWDGIHPTSAAHKALAARALQSIN